MLFTSDDCYHTAPYHYFLVLQGTLSQHYENIIFNLYILIYLFISFYYCVYLEGYVI